MPGSRRRRRDRGPDPRRKLPAPAETSTPALQEELFPEAIEVWRSLFSGPIPPPDVLSEYNQVLPGLAERIVRMTEDEGRHRRDVESRVVRLSELGLASATLIALTIIVGGLVAAVKGAEHAGFAAVLAAVTGLVAVFVVGRRSGPSAEPHGNEAGGESDPRPASGKRAPLAQLAG